ncbi:MAG: PRC-barrel domain-containing protein [Bacillota bacterium]|nr:PRC-barrel domain-containing protein [Bacillota bacterium]MDP4158410.1 PRC-barrel domain-containing protein [Bacillota bacterium]
MKPTTEIIGLRIISVSDGTQVGMVKDLILNPQGKTLDFIIVDQPADYFGAKVIAFTDILGLGEFALTIPNLEVIQDVAQSREVQNLLKQDIRVIGTKVLTKKGQLIGEVKEIQINEETGEIVACLFESDGQMHEIGANQIITLGKELLIVESETIPPNFENTRLSDETQTQTKTQVLDTPMDVLVSADRTEEPETSFNLFEQRQLQYFIGKRADKDIVLDNGEVLKAGETITPELVTHITSKSTLMEVTSHLQKN